MRTWEMLISVTSAERNIKLQIEYQCPQCGGPAVIAETDRVFRCAYCRVGSYLVAPDPFRYVLPVHPSVNRDIIHVPYWRFKGTLFSCGSDMIRNRHMDLSHSAIKGNLFPGSLGLRSQSLKLKFVDPEIKGRFLSADLSSKSAFKIFQDRFTSELPQPVYFQEYIGETLSLIYSPVYMNDVLHDAVINRAIGTNPDGPDISELAGGKIDWRLDFLPILCPDCGWNLEGDGNALVLACRNCDTLWMPVKKTLKKVSFEFDVPNAEPVTYLPFWTIKAEISGLPLKTMADLAKAANLPKAFQDDWHQQEFRFRVSAFKTRPDLFLRMATAMTLSQSRSRGESRIPKNAIYLQVNFSIMEAMESLKLIIADFVKPRSAFLPLLKEITVTPTRFALSFLPFTENRHEYIHSGLHLAVTKTHLRPDL